MVNDIGDAKQDSGTNFCTIEDVQRMGVETTYWNVDEDGEPTEFLDHTDSDFYEEQFRCEGCMDNFDNWNEVKEHLND